MAAVRPSSFRELHPRHASPARGPPRSRRHGRGRQNRAKRHRHAARGSAPRRLDARPDLAGDPVGDADLERPRAALLDTWKGRRWPRPERQRPAPVGVDEERDEVAAWRACSLEVGREALRHPRPERDETRPQRPEAERRSERERAVRLGQNGRPGPLVDPAAARIAADGARCRACGEGDEGQHGDRSHEAVEEHRRLDARGVRTMCAHRAASRSVPRLRITPPVGQRVTRTVSRNRSPYAAIRAGPMPCTSRSALRLEGRCLASSSSVRS